jgi:glycosyltransferase involved in cell wall biosynthesis
LDAIMNVVALHIGAGRYDANDRSSPTFEIWRNLALGCDSYSVIGRSVHARTQRLLHHNVHVTLMPSWFRSEAEFLLTQFASYPLARQLRPNVVVAQCPALGGLGALAFKMMSRARILMEFHGSHYFQRTPSSRAWLIQQLTRLSLPHATRIRALTERMKREIGLHFGERYLDRTVVVPPRVDLSTFRNVKSNWRLQAKPRVLIVGTLNENKGQGRFLQRVLEDRLNLEVWLVGDGPDRVRCQELAARYGRTDDVRLFGRLGHCELAELLPEADVMVVYSREEATPRVILEGMAAGLPIVATDVGFIRDILGADQEGLILGDQPEREVVALLLALFDDEALRTRLGTAARSRVEAEFSADVVFARYQALIRETAAA